MTVAIDDEGEPQVTVMAEDDVWYVNGSVARGAQTAFIPPCVNAAKPG